MLKLVKKSLKINKIEMVFNKRQFEEQKPEKIPILTKEYSFSFLHV